MSLADVSRVTKIKESVLTLLEADAFSDLPPQVFVIGFLRAHARVVGADGEKIVAAYRKCMASPGPLGPGFEATQTDASAPPSDDAPSKLEAAVGLLAALDKRRVGVALGVLLFIVVVTLTLSALLGHSTPANPIS